MSDILGNIYISYEKLSKKEKRKRDREKRGTWGDFNPITRIPKNPKAYDRDKSKRELARRDDYFD